MQDYRTRVNGRLETAADRARRFRWRIRIMTGAFAILFAILAGRAVFLMAAPSERLASLARRQHQQVVTLYPKRGTLYDRNGIELARSVEMDSVYADPKFVTDPVGAARTLAPLLKLSEQQIRAKLSQQLRFVWLARRIGPEQAAAIKAAKVPGIYSVPETRRFYPNRELAGALLGFSDIDNTGIEGLERTLNAHLNGEVTRYVRLRDAKGRNITPEGVLVRQNQDGGSVVLTLDRTLQYTAEKALQAAYTEFDAKGGFVIVMDAKTGELLAVANAPGYNPNVYSQYDPSAYKNQAVANSFEPGSTQKSFLIAAALQDRVIKVSDRFDCENGNYRVGSNIIHDTHPYGVLSVGEILQVSSNIGVTKIGDRLGKQRIYDYYRAFGFGESTKSGIPGEINGLLWSPRRWSRISLATHSFGQGMTVTGMQIASALSALANGGVRMKPYLVKAIKDQHGNVLQSFNPTELGHVVSKEVADQVVQFMTMVTQEGGTGTKGNIEGYTVAGKTGTAQKVENGRYAPGLYVSSFVGFVPAEAPRLVIVSVLDEPKGQHYGGTVSAPVFAEIARVGMRHLGIAPTAPPVAEEGKPDKKKSLQARVTMPETVPGEAVTTTEQTLPVIKPVTVEGQATEEYVLPDFTGQTMRSVLSALGDKLFALQLSGSGRVVSQVPEAGATIKSGETIKVVFSPEAVPPNRRKTEKR